MGTPYALSPRLASLKAVTAVRAEVSSHPVARQRVALLKERFKDDPVRLQEELERAFILARQEGLTRIHVARVEFTFWKPIQFYKALRYLWRNRWPK